MNFVPPFSLQTICIHEIILSINVQLIPTALGTSLGAEIDRRENQTKIPIQSSGGRISVVPSMKKALTR